MYQLVLSVKIMSWPICSRYVHMYSESAVDYLSSWVKYLTNLSYLLCLMRYINLLSSTQDSSMTWWSMCSWGRKQGNTSKLTKTLYCNGYHYYVLVPHCGYWCITNSHFCYVSCNWYIVLVKLPSPIHSIGHWCIVQVNLPSPIHSIGQCIALSTKKM